MSSASQQSKGWGAAAFIVVLAIAVNWGVTWFHYRHANVSPNDVTFRAAGAPTR